MFFKKLTDITPVAVLRDTSSFGIDAPVIQAGYACGLVALGTSGRTFDTLSLVVVGKVMRRTFFNASAIVPVGALATGDTLRAV